MKQMNRKNIITTFLSIARLPEAFLLALVSLGASAQLESVKELTMM